MAFALPIEYVDEDMANKIAKQCTVKPRKNGYEDTVSIVECYSVTDDYVYIPLGLWKEYYDTFPNVGPYPKAKFKYKRDLYTLETDPKHYRDQDVVMTEASERLEKEGSVFLALATGFGKSSCGLYLASIKKVKTIILCLSDTILEQWEADLEEFTNAKYQRIEGKKKVDADADVYLLGVLKGSKMESSVFSDIGMVIIDEAHMATVTAFSNVLLKFRPKYLVGMTATIERSDGLNKIFPLYFGPKEEFIYRKEVKNFTVYKCCTPFMPEIKWKRVPNGSIVRDWTHAINSLAYNEDRQNLIFHVLNKKHNMDPDAYSLILSDRKRECVALHNKFKETKHSTDLLIGPKNKKVKWDEMCRVLVAGRKKAGVGFNDSKRTVLGLCTDCKDVRQNEGRLRTVDCEIYDFVDNDEAFEKHWTKHREPWYVQKGANIVILDFRNGEVSAKVSESTSTNLPRMLKAND